MEKLNKLSICAGVLIYLLIICAAVDTITVNQTIKDGDTIVSADDNFQLGFFSLNTSTSRYLGIWSKRISPGTFVWVSNPGNPINDTSGVFKLSSDGRLLLLTGGGTGTVIWASGFPNSNIFNPMAQLLNTGNLVLRDARSIDQEKNIWQSNPPYDVCVRSGICGPYGTCNNNNSPVCSCLQGFEPRRPEEWRIADWSGGCQRVTLLNCINDGFNIISGMKLPDTRANSWYNVSMTIKECEMTCIRNCSCTAYATLDIQIGCLLWFGDLEDIRKKSGGGNLYVRLGKSELTDESKNKKVIKVVLSTSVSFLVVCLIVAIYTWRKKKRSSILITKGKPTQILEEDYTNESQKEPAELPSFSLSKIANSTNNFSINNKLGQGGFGPVYKGVLEGREIAVKRLSKTSRQGFNEFQNEVRCIARLQHRNLVKLLGYCIQGDEFMLIYEYMPNKSLDSFIFDEVKSLMLDWPSRFHIIHGIARGLRYLHQDSRLRIIHRDLKAGNILLDLDMNPKISDFGLARRFRRQESEANTNKVVGTLGYISPEYASNGHFSIKSDVFSFGVLLLEIVSGKKNRGFSHQDHNDNLLGHIIFSFLVPLPSTSGHESAVGVKCGLAKTGDHALPHFTNLETLLFPLLLWSGNHVTDYGA
ncbi:hypothetical protein L1987_11456 [Smallanthus sonchifolius]|uniref:Uncharacterized protein n=1 Tax=Smallanthus sonchifolius TaxID=185202 RepID=A0ACB9JD35_9ASTR|nr:hypothetical protein L1987_11456 [Smallanthus sonchifolius]